MPDNIFDVLDFVIMVHDGIVMARPPASNERALLPISRYKNRRTLCLDMDDTLILMLPDGSAFPNGMDDKLQPDTVVVSRECPSERGLVYLRPYLRTFLEAVNKMFEVVVFTAACKDYADQILDFIDPENRLFHHRLYRDSCVECTPNPEVTDAKVYIKDLTLLGRDLSDVILVDNSLQCFAYQLDGGVLCNPYKGNPLDDELVSILEILTVVNRNPETDVSRIFRKMYGVSQIVSEYKACGGRHGVKKARDLSYISRGDYTTPNKNNARNEQKETPGHSYPHSTRPKGSREREVRTPVDQRVIPNQEVADISLKRRPSLVPSTHFRASLGGG